MTAPPKDERLRAVQIVNTLSVTDGGPARNSFELNRALNQIAGCRVDLFWLKGSLSDSVLMNGSAIAEDLPEPGPRKLSVRTSVKHREAGLLTFCKDLFRSDVLIIHGYYLPWIPIVAVCGRLLGLRVYLMPHGALTTRQQKYSAKKKLIFDASLGWLIRRLLAAFVTGTEIERIELQSKFKKTRAKVAGVGVPIPSKARDLEPVHSPIRLLSMSRIAPKKRIDLSVDALSHLQKMGVDACLVVAGTGPGALVQRLKEQAQRLGVESKVVFSGQLTGEEKSQTFRDSDIFLLPSEDENFGIGFAEAISFGVPSVVSTNVAAAAELPQDAGILVPDPTGEKIAAAVQNLIQGRTYTAAQCASREYAVRNFSWTAAAEKWLAIIRT